MSSGKEVKEKREKINKDKKEISKRSQWRENEQ